MKTFEITYLVKGKNATGLYCYRYISAKNEDEAKNILLLHKNIEIIKVEEINHI